jgi:ATP-binding cassette subfamily C protein
VLVTQEIHVYAGTLADDLRLGRPGATDQELRDALDAVGATAWVATLPDGLDTLVGDGGHPLDATRVQLLALARVLLADPAVVVLDEATAEAGSAGAQVLDAGAAAVLAGRTGLVIAHRLSQAAAADHVIVMDHGRVAEQGTHEDLVHADGAYAALWRAWQRA